jgi:hypothetical protein
MATFEAQVEALTSLSIDGSSAPTQTELTQFLTDGAKEIINSFGNNSDLLAQCAAKQSTFTSAAIESEAETLNTGKVLSVYMTDSGATYPCRKINASQKYYYADTSVFASSQMEKATVTDPVYYVQNNKLNAIPASKTTGYSEVQFPSVAYGDSAIGVFPDEAEYLVPLYAAIKSLQNAMAAKSGNSDITTALGALKQCITNAGTEIGLAKVEAAEIASYTDNSGDLGTAPNDIATAVAKFSGAGTSADPALLGHETVYTTGEGLKKVNDALDVAISYINGDFPNASYDLVQNFADIDAEITNEDTELSSARVQQAQTTMAAIQSSVNIAQSHIADWNAALSALQAEIAGFASEVSSRSSVVSSKVQAVQSYINTANTYLSQASSNNNEIQARLSVLTTEYTWMEKQQAKLQADYDRGLQRISGQ